MSDKNRDDLVKCDLFNLIQASDAALSILDSQHPGYEERSEESIKALKQAVDTAFDALVQFCYRYKRRSARISKQSK